MAKAKTKGRMKKVTIIEIAAILVIAAVVISSYQFGQPQVPQFYEPVRPTYQPVFATESFSNCVQDALLQAEQCLLTDRANAAGCKAQSETALEACNRFQ